MSTKDQAWAERVGREAVALGMPANSRLRPLDISRYEHARADWEYWNDDAPDFRDRLTALACIAWVEDVARETAPPSGRSVSVHFDRDGFVYVEITGHTSEYENTWSAATLAEACIAAVRAMKGGE